MGRDAGGGGGSPVLLLLGPQPSPGRSRKGECVQSAEASRAEEPRDSPQGVLWAQYPMAEEQMVTRDHPQSWHRPSFTEGAALGGMSCASPTSCDLSVGGGDPSCSQLKNSGQRRVLPLGATT